MTLTPLSMIPGIHASRLGADRWCLRHGDDMLSWGELDTRSTRRAHALRRVGVRRDDLVMLSLPNGNALYELTFAVWKLGATPSVVSAKLPPAELAAILDLAEPRAFIAEGQASEVRRGALPTDFGRDVSDLAPLEVEVSRRWKAMASGGSTGRPKLIVDHLPAAFDIDEAPLGLPADGVMLNPGPCHHNMPFGMSHRALVRGCSVVGMPRFDPAEALALIERHRVGWVNFVPTMMRRMWGLPLAERDAFDLSSLTAVWHTAAPMPSWLKRAWIDWIGGDRLFECYGGTEGLGITALSGTEWLDHPGSVGRPIGCDIRVLDEEGHELPAGATGEIFFFPPKGGAHPFHYVGTEARRGADGAVSLGDRGWKDREGYLYVAGRRTDMILSGGVNIYPAEIENVLSACAGVEAAVVIGLPDDDLGERLHAIIEPVDLADPPSESLLREAVTERVARNKWPRSYEFVDEPLRDAAGKVRRSLLRDARCGIGTASRGR